MKMFHRPAAGSVFGGWQNSDGATVTYEATVTTTDGEFAADVVAAGLNEDGTIALETRVAVTALVPDTTREATIEVTATVSPAGGGKPVTQTFTSRAAF